MPLCQFISQGCHLHLNTLLSLENKYFSAPENDFVQPENELCWLSLPETQYRNEQYSSRAAQLKFGCPHMSRYASHYHYGRQSIAHSGEQECWTGWSQPVNCINLHKHRVQHCIAEWTYCLFPILCQRSRQKVPYSAVWSIGSYTTHKA